MSLNPRKGLYAMGNATGTGGAGSGIHGDGAVEVRGTNGNDDTAEGLGSFQTDVEIQ